MGTTPTYNSAAVKLGSTAPDTSGLRHKCSIRKTCDSIDPTRVAPTRADHRVERICRADSEGSLCVGRGAQGEIRTRQ